MSALKTHQFPRPVPCGRRFGVACLALYFPRRCGRLNPLEMIRGYRWANDQRALFPRYRAVVVNSGHMGREFAENGVPGDCLHVNPLFPGAEAVGGLPERAGPPAGRVLFLGRMTTLKGGDLLVRAAAGSGAKLGRPLTLVMAGDGPQRGEWEALAGRLGVRAEFPGWLAAEGRAAELRAADVAAVPSVWPEPFGMVGLEAGLAGVPAVAFDVGGVREWLDDGVTGFLAPGHPPTASGLAAALVRALSDPVGLRTAGRAARAKAEAMSLAAHLDRLEPIFEAALRGD